MEVQNIMRPVAAAIQVDQRAHEALEYFRDKKEENYMVVLDGDEAISILCRHLIRDLASENADFMTEMIGNLDLPRIRTCRAYDDTSMLPDLLYSANVDMVIAEDPEKRRFGVILPDDIPKT